MGGNTLENMLVCSKPQQERKPRPQPEQALKCPRCDSINTKFCYYNNYSLSQPRYFCKSCRRYWTKGGTLRNVPVGGGCRKNKRSSSSSSLSSRKNQDLNPTTNPLLTTLPPLTYDPNDLTLAFARLQKQSNGQLGIDDYELSILGNPIGNNPSVGNHSFLDAVRNGFLDNTQSNNFQNLFYHGYGNGGFCGVGEMMVPNYNEEISSSSSAATQAVTVTTMKQELCNSTGKEDEESKILWGFPWQINGNYGIGDDLDSSSARESWNSTGIGSTWHGVLNSPLM